jgi:hypothetical protein
MATTDDVRIGDFTRPVVNAPNPASTGSSPSKDALDQAEQKLETAARRDDAVLKPIASYEDRLREVDVSKEKASEIIDAVLLKGYYAEDVVITKTITARFRTRNARDTKRAQEQIEAQRLTYDIHYSEVLARLLLASSLERFASDAFTHHPRGAKYDAIEKAFSDRLTYVESLSDPAMRLLITKLSKFDRMISVVLEEGSIENF